MNKNISDKDLLDLLFSDSNLVSRSEELFRLILSNDIFKNNPMLVFSFYDYTNTVSYKFLYEKAALYLNDDNKNNPLQEILSTYWKHSGFFSLGPIVTSLIKKRVPKYLPKEIIASRISHNLVIATEDIPSTSDLLILISALNSEGARALDQKIIFDNISKKDFEILANPVEVILDILQQAYKNGDLNFAMDFTPDQASLLGLVGKEIDKANYFALDIGDDGKLKTHYNICSASHSLQDLINSDVPEVKEIIESLISRYNEFNLVTSSSSDSTTSESYSDDMSEYSDGMSEASDESYDNDEDFYSAKSRYSDISIDSFSDIEGEVSIIDINGDERYDQNAPVKDHSGFAACHDTEYSGHANEAVYTSSDHEEGNNRKPSYISRICSFIAYPFIKLYELVFGKSEQESLKISPETSHAKMVAEPPREKMIPSRGKDNIPKSIKPTRKE